MRKWLQDRWKHEPNREVFVRRGLEAMREIGVLFMAFAPLDGMLGNGQGTGHALAATIFFVMGVVVFVLATVGEWRDRQ